MKLWLISQDESHNRDTYDSAVVCYETEVEARNHFPGGGKWGRRWSAWCCYPAQVVVKYLGEASSDVKQGEVIASFNAG